VLLRAAGVVGCQGRACGWGPHTIAGAAAARCARACASGNMCVPPEGIDAHEDPTPAGRGLRGGDPGARDRGGDPAALPVARRPARGGQPGLRRRPALAARPRDPGARPARAQGHLLPDPRRGHGARAHGRAARSGHELGNHSLFHQCSARGAGREWVKPEQDLDTTTGARMQAQVAVANTMRRAIDGSTEFTYTAPCGDRAAADGDYIAAVAPMFLGIKLVGGDVVPDMWALDRAAVPVTVPVDATGAELIALVEEAGRRGTM